MTRLFIPQQWADRALASDAIQIEGLVLTVVEDQARYKLTEAVRVQAVEGGEPDAAGVLGKVLSRDEVRAKDGELIDESLILSDTAYKVRVGFLAVPESPDAPLSALFSRQL